MEAKESTYVKTIIRPVAEDEINLIISSWTKSFRGSSFAKQIKEPIYFKYQKEVIANLFEASQLLVATSPEDTSHIYGWICASPLGAGVTALHYVYVKHPYRGLGIGTALYNEALNYCESDRGMATIATHSTYMLENVLNHKWNIIYNPYILKEFVCQK